MRVMNSKDKEWEEGSKGHQGYYVAGSEPRCSAALESSFLSAISERVQRGKAGLSHRPHRADRISPRYSLLLNEGICQCDPAMSPVRRRAAGLAHMMAHVPVKILDHELIVGSNFLPPLDEKESRRRGTVDKEVNRRFPWPGGISGHMAIDNEWLLTGGIADAWALIARKEEEIRAASASEDRRMAALDFYAAARTALEAVVRFARRHAEEARRLADEETDDARRQELLRIAAVCEQVPGRPARSFHEALQSVYFLFFLTTIEAGLMSLGRMDRYLAPYYRADIASGSLSPGEALELLECLFIKINEWRQSAQTIMIGGRGDDGCDATNEVTWLILEATDALRLVDPSIGLAVHCDTPPPLLERAARMLCQGVTHPALFNDETIVRGLERIGVAPSDARRHVHSCTEPSPEGKSGIWLVAGYMNFAKCLEQALHNGIDPVTGEQNGRATGEPGDWRTFDQVVTAVKRQLAWTVQENCSCQDRFARQRMRLPWFPLLSCFVRDCLERGMDLDEGGACYYYFYPQLVGFPTVVDALSAVRELVFETGEIDLPELIDILDRNFEGSELLRQKIINTLPKYGNGLEGPDRLAVDLSNFYMDEVEKYINAYGFGYHPGYLCWKQHAVLGAETGATADGRLAGTALSDSLGAVQGRASAGPTGVLATVERLDVVRGIGAVVVNLWFDPRSLEGEKGPSALADLVRTHFARGGFQLQINVVRRETLLAARDHPEQYRDLLVRVGGYSGYFTLLEPTLQDEVIRRTA